MKGYYYSLIVISIFTILFSCKKKIVKSYSPQNKVCNLPSSSESSGDYFAPRTEEYILIDGKSNEVSWNNAPWREIKYEWSGTQYSSQNFSGRYKIQWDENRIFFLIETTDNLLIIQNDITVQWKEKDFIKIYMDEGRSKEEDNYQRKSLIYFISTDENIFLNGNDKLDKDQALVKRITTGNKSVWEVEMKVLKNSNNEKEQSYIDNLKLSEIIGFAIAYQDYDGPGKNESLIGSIKMPDDEKTFSGDASSLGILELIK